jgi:ADP-ribosyl-[dinitrogen reductase] hydrolase
MNTDRIKGCFYGCAVGDALGAPLEFSVRDTAPLLTEMAPVRRFRLAAGSWTDDTSMMLCLAASIAAQGGKLDAYSELSHYYEWWDKGYLSVNGDCFDIGRTTTVALSEFDRKRTTVAPTAHEQFCGNGSLMRIVPIPILAAGDVEKARAFGAQSSETTHAHPLCKDACGLFAALVTRALAGDNKPELLAVLRGAASRIVDAQLMPICAGNFLTKSRDEISSSGFVVNTLEAALWAFFTTGSFKDGAILAVNLCDDADTVGAVYGTLAGAYYGFSAIPPSWESALQGRRMLDGVFADFCAAAGL